MKIVRDSIKVIKDTNNRYVTQFETDNGAVWELDDKGDFTKISLDAYELQNNFDVFLGEDEPEKPKRGL